MDRMGEQLWRFSVRTLRAGITDLDDVIPITHIPVA